MARPTVFTRCAEERALAAAAADAIAAASARAIAAHGEFRLALSGGKTPLLTYGELARRRVEWPRVAIFFSDERCVPADHDDSNFHRARAALLAHVPIPDARVHRMRGELTPQDGAQEYERLLAGLDTRSRTFDLCLLGLGSDGHCASLFPGSAACAETRRRVVATPAPPLVAPPWRLTLTLPCIAESQDVLFLVAGADKAAVVRAIEQGAGETFPAAHVRARGQVRYLVSGPAWGSSSEPARTET